MKTQDVTQTYHFNPEITKQQYEVIEHEVLTNCIQKDLTISGSLLSKNVFKNVTFRNCVFFGSRFEECDFIGCTFENCEFQFSSVTRCNFKGTTFKNCTWATTPINQSSLVNCLLDKKTMHFVSKYDNHMGGCFREEHEDFGSLRNEIAA